MRVIIIIKKKKASDGNGNFTKLWNSSPIDVLYSASVQGAGWMICVSFFFYRSLFATKETNYNNRSVFCIYSLCACVVADAINPILPKTVQRLLVFKFQNEVKKANVEPTTIRLRAIRYGENTNFVCEYIRRIFFFFRLLLRRVSFFSFDSKLVATRITLSMVFFFTEICTLWTIRAAYSETGTFQLLGQLVIWALGLRKILQ